MASTGLVSNLPSVPDATYGALRVNWVCLSAGEYLSVDEIKKTVRVDRPLQERLSDLVQLNFSRQFVLQALAREFTLSNSVSSELSPPRALLGQVVRPVRRCNFQGGESGLSYPRVKMSPRVGVNMVYPGQPLVNVHLPIDARIIRGPAESSVVAVAYGEQAPIAQDSAHLGEYGDRIA